MAVRVKRITLWRAAVEDRPGVLAGALEPLAHAGTDLQMVMCYGNPGQEGQATIEVYPILPKRAVAAAQIGGFSASPVPVVFVEGDNKPGLGYSIANAVAWAGLNIRFMLAHVTGKKYSAIVGFETEADAQKGELQIKKAHAPLRMQSMKSQKRKKRKYK